MVDINTQRINTSHIHVYSQIELVTFDQVRLVHIPLNDHMLDYTSLRRMYRLLSSQSFRISSQKDPLSLTTSLRFHNESPVTLLVDLRQEFGKILREHICGRKERILLWEGILESHQVSTEHVLLCQIVHARKMIGPLKWLHRFEKACRDRKIEPGYVPRTIGSLGEVILKHELALLANHVIVGVLRVHDHPILPIGYLVGVLLIGRV